MRNPVLQQPKKKDPGIKLDGMEKRPKRLMSGKPKGKRDSEGRYNFSKGGSANLVASAMDVLKPN